MVWPAVAAEGFIFTEEAMAPAHDGILRAGASLRGEPAAVAHPLPNAGTS